MPCFAHFNLKAVVMKNFVGGLNELNVMMYFVRSGCEREHVLENIKLYVAYGLEETQKIFAYTGVECCSEVQSMFKFLVHNCEKIFFVNIFNLAFSYSK